MKSIFIVDSDKLRARVDSLKNRSDDIKARIAPVLKNLWFSERMLNEVKADINFDEIDLTFPHFAEVTNFYKNQIMIARKLKSHFKSPPVLLLGEPGLGKTFYANHIARLQDLPFYEISMATTSASFELSGSSLQWGDGSPGFITESLAKSSVANPVFVVDEIDKASGSTRFNPLNVFYCLLEPHTASRYKDEALGLEMDARHVIWILTANDQVDIKSPILSRMKVFTIKQPEKSLMRGVVQSIMKSLVTADGLENLISSELSDDVIELLSKLTPRQIRMALQEAITKALVADRSQLTADHIPQQKLGKEVDRVGFI